MFKIAVFDTKEYDSLGFNENNIYEKLEFTYFSEKLTAETKQLAKGFDAVCVFVNDSVTSEVVEYLKDNNVQLILTRSAGFNQIDIEKANELEIPVLRVPAYSPNAVAEFAVTLLMTVNRNVHLSYQRIKQHNFSIAGLTGIDIYGKTIGVIGAGKIGQIFCEIMRGFGATVIAYSPVQDAEWAKANNVTFVELDELYLRSDVISLHCPLMESTYHLIDDEAISKMKSDVYIINTSRGGLIDTEALIRGLISRKIKAVGLDVYEKETDYFFEDFSEIELNDKALAKLTRFENVLLTSHQAFLTNEALGEIYQTTIGNAMAFVDGEELKNRVQ